MADGRLPDGRFAPGSSGGPGRGKAPRRIEGLLRKLGEELVPDESGLPITRLQRLMDRVYTIAEEGEQWAVTFIADRTEGKVKDSQVVEQPDLVPVEGLTFKAKERTVGA